MSARNFTCFPNSYLVFDLETTGLDRRSDLIWQIGHCLVNDGEVQDKGSFVINWLDDPATDRLWLVNRISKLASAMEASGRKSQLTVEKVAAGEPAKVVLDRYWKLLTKSRQDRLFFLTHNGYQFDCKFIEEAFERTLGGIFRFNDYEVFDTGMVEKASQALMGVREGDTPRSFAQRIAASRLKGVHWSLDRHCIPKYDLATDHDLDVNEAHDAGFDAYVTHLLFNKMRELTDADLRDRPG
jgi:DNA polymerase III epsilon subunit-like protein